MRDLAEDKKTDWEWHRKTEIKTEREWEMGRERKLKEEII